MYAYFRNRWDSGAGSTDTKSGEKLQRLIDVEHDTPGITSADIRSILASLPVVSERIYKGVPHPVYANARCVNIAYAPSDADPLLGTVTADYEEPAPYLGGGELYPGGVPGGSSSGGTTNQQPKPEDRPPVSLKGSFRRVDTYPDQDLDGVKFENPAGDRFDNPPPVPRASGVMQFTSYHAADAWNFAIGRAWMNKVNSDAWQGFAARTCTVIGLNYELKNENGYIFWQLDWQIEVGEQTYFDANNTVPATAYNVAADRVRIPQYGYNAYGTANTTATKAEIMVNGKPLASPAKLNADGTVRAADLKPLCKDFRVRDLIAFAGL